MSDFENFIKMLTDGNFYYTLIEDKKSGNNTVRLEPDYFPNKGIYGYAGFLAEFEFDRTGKLVKIGIWE